VLVIVLPLLPLIVIGLAWWLYRRDREKLPSWRRAVFLAGVLANAVSGAVLLAFFIHGYAASRGSKSVDLDRTYPVLSMMCLALFAALFALFGRRASRCILFGDGLMTFIAWYLAAMGASP
jgi:amino acid transporter